MAEEINGYHNRESRALRDERRPGYIHFSEDMRSTGLRDVKDEPVPLQWFIEVASTD